MCSATIRRGIRSASIRSSGLGSRSSSSQLPASRSLLPPDFVASGVTIRKKTPITIRFVTRLAPLSLFGSNGSTQNPIAKTTAAPIRFAKTSETLSRIWVLSARVLPDSSGWGNSHPRALARAVATGPAYARAPPDGLRGPAQVVAARAFRPDATGGVPSRISARRRAANSPWSSPMR